MTEAEWLASKVPQKLREHLATVGASDRKMRLFAASACRRASDWIRFPFLFEALDVLERYADSQATSDELVEANASADEVVEYHPRFSESDEADGVLDAVYAAAQAIAQATCNDPVGEDQPTYFDRLYDTIMHVAETAAYGRSEEVNDGVNALAAQIAEYEALAGLMKCVFGNPFRPVAVNPSWLTSTVLALAGGIYEERAFDRLPILADALMDAGCDDEQVLTHCRDAGPHVRGCWVVDLLLGKA
jgi:hypothetical protein